MSFLQGRAKRYFLRSSGVRHRKWKLLGVKLPDFTVGMSSHCIIRGYSPSASAGKRSGKTAASLPEPVGMFCVSIACTMTEKMSKD